MSGCQAVPEHPPMMTTTELRQEAAELPQPVQQHPQYPGLTCGPRQGIIERLKKKYKEEPVAIGMVQNGWVMEITSNAQNEWTALMTRPDGVTCIVAVGQDWQSIEKVSGLGA
ncbi:hypothetical protein OAF54_00755 [bacterium]|nr:hypothetical protein [bacterium]